MRAGEEEHGKLLLEEGRRQERKGEEEWQALERTEELVGRAAD